MSVFRLRYVIITIPRTADFALCALSKAEPCSDTYRFVQPQPVDSIVPVLHYDRVVIGYWAFNVRSGEPYISGQVCSHVFLSFCS